MSHYRRAITQARFNAGPSGVVALEFALTALIIGALYESLALGFSVFMILSMGIVIPYLSLLIILAYTAVCGG